MTTITIYDDSANTFTPTHNLFYVYLAGDRIVTTVTATPSVVDSWIAETESMHRLSLHRLIVGLDVEWRPSYSRVQNPVATLQLCVGRRCLVFQLLHAPRVPASLSRFLYHENCIFAGVAINQDVQKLESFYGLGVQNTWDLGIMAVDAYGDGSLRGSGLKDLALMVLGKSIEKPRNVTMSAWDARELSPEQVKYACVDAFASLEIALVLDSAFN